MLTVAQRDKWCAALRSGAYQQGQEALRVPIGEDFVHHFTYCCMGVLDDVMEQEGVIVRKTDCGRFSVNIAPIEEIYLSNAIQFELGEMNDGYTDLEADIQVTPKSFEYIAWWIELNVPVQL